MSRVHGCTAYFRVSCKQRTTYHASALDSFAYGSPGLQDRPLSASVVYYSQIPQLGGRVTQKKKKIPQLVLQETCCCGLGAEQHVLQDALHGPNTQTLTKQNAGDIHYSPSNSGHVEEVLIFMIIHTLKACNPLRLIAVLHHNRVSYRLHYTGSLHTGANQLIQYNSTPRRYPPSLAFENGACHCYGR
jgi:hypothetical protein